MNYDATYLYGCQMEKTYLVDYQHQRWRPHHSDSSPQSQEPYQAQHCIMSLAASRQAVLTLLHTTTTQVAFVVDVLINGSLCPTSSSPEAVLTESILCDKLLLFSILG